MSASLVGSEMCIRDRCPPQSRPIWPTTSGARKIHPWTIRRSPIARDRACLLYTSDAADDM
eukprot:4746660-Alexandrium_andersonii.AAC.1